jgi:hypothetical protein
MRTATSSVRGSWLLLLLSLLFSTAAGQQDGLVTIYENPTFTSLRQCAQNCFVITALTTRNLLGPKIRCSISTVKSSKLAMNNCYCRPDLRTDATSSSRAASAPNARLTRTTSPQPSLFTTITAHRTGIMALAHQSLLPLPGITGTVLDQVLRPALARELRGCLRAEPDLPRIQPGRCQVNWFLSWRVWYVNLDHLSFVNA